jgi:hypothetical protein
MTAAFVALTIATLYPALPNTSPPLPCAHVQAKLTGSIDSSAALAIDNFPFVTTEPVVYDGHGIPAGTKGIGVVVVSQHALASSEPGVLAIETRFLQLRNGTHVPVSIVPPRTQLYRGGRNTLGIITAVPYLGIAAAAYNALNHGKDATIPKGTRLLLAIGDDAIENGCRGSLTTWR